MTKRAVNGRWKRLITLRTTRTFCKTLDENRVLFNQGRINEDIPRGREFVAVPIALNKIVRDNKCLANERKADGDLRVFFIFPDIITALHKVKGGKLIRKRNKMIISEVTEETKIHIANVSRGHIRNGSRV